MNEWRRRRRHRKLAEIVVTWVKSAIGYSRDQRDTIRALGLRRLNQKVKVEDNPSMRGMITKVRHLLKVEEGGK
ncbi:MAG: 50S ribosomal protein L30 [Chloroflexi bacterium]|nr:50S ribosomal protein L30 [Chloroflexota bacterium]